MGDKLDNYHDVDLDEILDKMKIKPGRYQEAAANVRKSGIFDEDYVKATFAYRFSCCVGDKSIKAIAEDLKISSTAVFEYKWGQSEPRLTVVSKIAKYFGVSADYLLGSTSTKTTIPEKKKACEYTGLSDAAVDKLNAGQNDDSHPLYSAIISCLLESGALDNLVKLLEKALVQREQYSVLFDEGDEQRENVLETQEYQINRQLAGLYSTVIAALSQNLSGQITYIAGKRFMDFVEGAVDTREKMQQIIDAALSDPEVFDLYNRRKQEFE